MSSFSNILDISSFFIGVLVNLLLVALICFYFKRKIDNLEMSQSEQAKMLFQLIQQKESNPSPTEDAPMLPGGAYNMLNGLDLSQLNDDEDEEDEEDEEDNNAVNGESSDDDDDDSSSDDEEDQEEKGEEIKKIEYEEVKDELDIEKMTVKEIRNLLENKGVQVQKKNIKKQELIDLYKGVDVPVEEVIETVVKVEEEVLELDQNGVGDISPEIIIDE
jgi:hypothetical protein